DFHVTGVQTCALPIFLQFCSGGYDATGNWADACSIARSLSISCKKFFEIKSAQSQSLVYILCVCGQLVQKNHNKSCLATCFQTRSEERRVGNRSRVPG